MFAGLKNLEYMNDVNIIFLSVLDMNEDSNKDGIPVSLFRNDENEKQVEEIKSDIFDAKTTIIYVKDEDEDELYIAASPSFSPVNNEKSQIAHLYETQDELCKTKDSSVVSSKIIPDEEFELHSKAMAPDSLCSDSETIEFSPTKSSDAFSGIDSSSYFVASDNYHMSIDVSKTYFYVVSPTGGSAILKSTDEPLIRVDSADQLISVTDSSTKCLDTAQVTPITKHLSSDQNSVQPTECNITYDHTSEHINLVTSTEIDVSEKDTVHGRFDNISGELTFIGEVENSVSGASSECERERSQLIWQPMSAVEEEVIIEYFIRNL